VLGAVRKAVKDSVRDEGHAGDGESGESFKGDVFKDTEMIVRHFSVPCVGVYSSDASGSGAHQRHTYEFN
jgi:hypothetical protein